MKTKRQRFLIEQLEDRTVPATWGVAWPGADHLKVSFAPDGTGVSGTTSVLFQKLNAIGATKAWQTEILRALQTWASAANINFGVVGDGGQALGTSGPAQGDPRFGDIRIAARSMGSDVLGLTNPYDPTIGTLAGDVVLNGDASLGLGGSGKYDLFTLALHETGHSLGLDNNLDPTSIMYQSYSGARTSPSATDVAMVQAMYGTRKADNYEGPLGNNTLTTATIMKLPEVAADITTNGDADFYRYTVPSYADRTITITVRTAGLSLLTPKLTVYNAYGQAVSTASSTDPLNNTVALTLSNVKRGSTLYLKVEGARTDVFGIGGYRLKVDSGGVSQAQIKAIDAVLDGTALNATVGDQNNHTQATATNLNQLIYQLDQRFDFSVNAAIRNASLADFYKVVAPSATASGPQTLIATVTQTGTSALHPNITVYNSSGQQVDFEVVVNDGGSYVVQVIGATPGATYFLAVSDDPYDTVASHQTGSYLLGVNFEDSPIVLQTYVDDNLSQSNQVDVVSLNVSSSRFFELALSATTGDYGGPVQVAVRMNIYDASGVLVVSIDAQDGDTVSKNVYLGLGNYTARFVAATKDGSLLPEVWYTLQGRVLGGPDDPLPIDPTLDPTHPPPPPPTTPPITVGTSPPPPTLPPVDPTSNPWTPPPPMPPPPIPT